MAAALNMATGPVKLGDLVGADLARSLSESDRGLSIAGVTCDSRQVRPGYLFAALPGTKTDGGRFVREAVSRGARAVLTRPDFVGSAGDAVFVIDRNPRRRFSLLAARFFAEQPKTIAAITGTNGKTSVAHFLRQIWTQLGTPAASIGTLGVIAPTMTTDFGLTTPDPVQLHETLERLKAQGIEHVAMEASSHGLAQHRLDGVRLAAAAITNLTRDHLDYHASFEDYAYAKLRLFGELLTPGCAAIVNADVPIGAEAEALSWARGLRTITVGWKGQDIKLLEAAACGTGQRFAVLCEGRRYEGVLALAGAFQLSNALIAAGLALGTGSPPERVFSALERLNGTPGRLEHVACLPNGASIYIDYAHTPDALETVMTALRPHTKNQLHLVFGCGGDRDRGKRPIMGQIGARLADRVIITDDNPRTEDPAGIRAQILDGAPSADVIPDRAAAIATAMARLGSGDLLIVAGKGHERGQIIGDTVLPFSDREVIQKVAAEIGGDK